MENESKISEILSQSPDSSDGNLIVDTSYVSTDVSTDLNSTTIAEIDARTDVIASSITIDSYHPTENTQEFTSTRLNISEGECEDAKSTSSSYPFSSPNTSEYDDHGGNDPTVSCSTSRKTLRRRRHRNESSSASVAPSSSTVMPGNRPSFPLSERQQMALAMQLSAQDQPNDHDSCSPTVSTSASSSSAGRARGKLAKVHRRNERGETPLHLAAKRGEFQHCLELIDDGADVNCVDYAGWTPLHEACNQGWYKTAKILLEHGANVNVCGLDDDTPLHDAALSGHRKLVILLRQCGADPFKYNKQGKRPVDVAEDPEIQQLMFETPGSLNSPLLNYAVNSPRNEENEPERRTPCDLDKTLTTEEVGLESSSTMALSEGPVTRRENEGNAQVTSDREHQNQGDHEEKAFGLQGVYDAFYPSNDVSGDIPGDSSNAAYASTESENELRLVVVEEDSGMVEQVPVEDNTVMDTSMNETPDSCTPTASTKSAPSGDTTMDDVGKATTNTLRPRRQATLMKRRKVKLAGIDDLASKSSLIRAKRKRPITIGATKPKDVYEFHSSDSDDESGSGKKLRKYSKTNMRTRRPLGKSFSLMARSGSFAEMPSSSMEPDTKLVQEKPEDESKERTMTGNTPTSSVGAKMEEVATPFLGAKEEQQASSCLGMKEDQPASAPSITIPAPGQSVPMEMENRSKYDSQLVLEQGKEMESSQHIRCAISTPNLHSLETEAKTSSLVTVSTVLSGDIEVKEPVVGGSRKERLLGFGRRRTGFGPPASVEKQKEREAHIENVVASIGSGVVNVGSGPSLDLQARWAGEQVQKKASTEFMNEPAQKKASVESGKELAQKKTSTESVKEPAQKKTSVECLKEPAQKKTSTESMNQETTTDQEQQKPRMRGSENNEEEDNSIQSALKVPPLKLVLAGRSNSEEDSNSQNASNSREATARTYVVQSGANSPAIERRASIAGDTVDSYQCGQNERLEEGRRTVSNSNSNGNGNGEGVQRVTRSQVRLHGAQLDRNVDDTTVLHPRKRKLRSAKTMIEPVAANRQLLPVVSPSLAAIAVKNSYEAHQHMKKEIANKWKQEIQNSGRTSTTAPVKAFEHFLIRKKNYLLQGAVKDDPGCEEKTVPSSSLPPELTELHRRQSDERRAMETRHQVERERLITSCENEAIRAHNRCIRGTPDPPLTIMRLLRDADLYNPLQLDKNVPFSVAGSSGQEYGPPAGNDVTSRFTKAKRQLVGRQRLEAQCLYSTQVQEWEMRLKSPLIQQSESLSIDGVRIFYNGVLQDGATRIEISTLHCERSISGREEEGHCWEYGRDRGRRAVVPSLAWIDCHVGSGSGSDLFCQRSKKGWVIVGYYHADERLNSSSPDALAHKVVEKIQTSFSEPVVLAVDNTQLAIDCDQPCYRVYTKLDSGEAWKQKDTQKFYLEDEEKALMVASACVQTKLCRELIDFENHLDDISLDFANCALNEKIKQIF